MLLCYSGYKWIIVDQRERDIFKARDETNQAATKGV